MLNFCDFIQVFVFKTNHLHKPSDFVQQNRRRSRVGDRGLIALTW